MILNLIKNRLFRNAAIIMFWLPLHYDHVFIYFAFALYVWCVECPSSSSGNTTFVGKRRIRCGRRPIVAAVPALGAACSNDAA
jgi:hypothetical protein